MKTITTLSIAEVTNKRHDNVIRDVRKLIANLNPGYSWLTLTQKELKDSSNLSRPTKKISPDLGQSPENINIDDSSKVRAPIELLTLEEHGFEFSTYKNDQNKDQPLVILTEEMAMTFITRYNDKLRHKVIKALYAVEASETIDEVREVLSNVFSDLRGSMRESHTPFTDIIKANLDTLQLKPEHAYSTIMNLICKAVCGINATQFKDTYNIPPRDYWAITRNNNLYEYNKTLGKVEGFIEAGLSYTQIKEKLKVK